jgi:hypothetical protein
MNNLLTALALIASLLVLDVAAVLWGADSREGPESAEWERRRHWKGFRW